MVFKKRESSKAAAARMSSYRFMKTRQSKEAWRVLKPHNPEVRSSPALATLRRVPRLHFRAGPESVCVC